jgi:hypothetical protein
VAAELESDTPYDSIGRVTTVGVVTNYTGTGISYPEGVTAGPDGALWFTNYNSIGRITTAGVVSNYTGTGISHPDGITTGPDGALWFTNSGRGGDDDRRFIDGDSSTRSSGNGSRGEDVLWQESPITTLSTVSDGGWMFLRSFANGHKRLQVLPK